MNRRSFFASLLGAACLAVAERVLPSSIGAVKPVFAEPDWQQWGSYRVYLPESERRRIGEAVVSRMVNLLSNPPYVGDKMMDLSGLKVPSMLRRDEP